MKVIIKETEKDKYGEGEYYEIKTPKNSISFCDMEPEDACFSRDLNDIFQIPTMLEEAYNAGKNGEEFEIIEESTDEG